MLPRGVVCRLGDRSAARCGSSVDARVESRPMSGGRLIILCGLPGSGKSTLARSLEASLGAIRMSPDDWMEALGINLYDEAARAKIEALQWTLAQQLLSRGLTVTIEWGTWGHSERETLRLGARALGC